MNASRSNIVTGIVRADAVLKVPIEVLLQPLTIQLIFVLSEQRWLVVEGLLLSHRQPGLFPGGL